MKAQIQFLGSDSSVTGSRILLSVGNEKYLIDCGLFQGAKEMRNKNWQNFSCSPKDVTAVVLTHAHLDHSGYLPKFYKEGYRGPIFTSPGSSDLASVLLLDAAYLEEEQAKFANESGYSNHRPAYPLFRTEDAEACLKKFETVPRNNWVCISKNVSFRLLRAGHIIGASMVQFAISNDNTTKTVTFSGDIGHERSRVLKGPVNLNEENVLVLESTYGNRLHSKESSLEQLAMIANRTFEREGVLVIPSFAVGRAQELTFMIRELENRGAIPKVPVILDSPMAARATEIFLEHPEDQIISSEFLGHGDVFAPALYEICETPDESMLACMRDGPMIVISASGMLNGGRILHHLKTRLPDEKNTVVFSGYQAEGTKGRFLQDNASGLESLRIHHKEVPIRAEIHTLDALSAHADYSEIIEWIKRSRQVPKKIILNHGTEESQNQFAEKLRTEFGVEVIVSHRNKIINI